MKHISMFIIAIFLGGVPANAAPDNLKVEGYMPWKQDGVETSFATTDSTLDAVLEANPNALIILRFGVTWAPAWWVEKNLGERTVYDSGEFGIPSIYSLVWRAAAAGST